MSEKRKKRAIVLTFVSLNRHWLSPYGGDLADTPNFQRLADHSVTFDTSYVASMPCMPARRDLHTSRPNFLHTSWGPLEPYDDSFVEMLKNSGVYTHLATDHYHYWEDGGATYHNRYTSYEFFRGQEGDPWKGVVADPEIPPTINQKGRRQDWVNRQFLKKDADHYQTNTLDAGIEFLDTNFEQDDWMLMVECFDPHEPFFVSEDDPHAPSPPSDCEPLFDWPGYQPVTETNEEVERCRQNYRNLLRKCDRSLGRILDRMDDYNLWEDTLLIVWTDHGYFLGEHNAWAKNWLPLYEEVGHTPFFMWDPENPLQGERRKALIQPSLDLAPTLLDYFERDCSPHMLGHSLRPLIALDTPVREHAIFGYFGNGVGCTDGRYVYFRQPTVTGNSELYHYRLMPTSMREFFSLDMLSRATLHDGFSFTKGAKLLRIPVDQNPRGDDAQPSTLYDLSVDPHQQNPISNTEIEKKLVGGIRTEMCRCEAPDEQYVRMGIEAKVRTDSKLVSN